MLIHSIWLYVTIWGSGIRQCSFNGNTKHPLVTDPFENTVSETGTTAGKDDINAYLSIAEQVYGYQGLWYVGTGHLYGPTSGGTW